LKIKQEVERIAAEEKAKEDEEAAALAEKEKAEAGEGGDEPAVDGEKPDGDEENKS